VRDGGKVPEIFDKIKSIDTITTISLDLSVKAEGRKKKEERLLIPEIAN
jgi:hypothetical protein